MAVRLVTRRVYASELSPAALHERLAGIVEPDDGGFELISRISPAGIVVRALRVPASERPFFGQLTAERLTIAHVTRDEHTPFQPILRGVVAPADGGSRLEVELKPAAGVRTFETPARIVAVVVAAASLPALLSGQAAAALALLFAAAFWVFPGRRARAAFEHDCARSLQALEDALPIRAALRPADANQGP